MSRYAAKTDVPVERSRAELERLLRNRGARQIVNYTETETGLAVVQFMMQDRMLRFTVVVPPIATYAVDKYGYANTEAQQRRAWEQEERRRWRVMILTIKAKLEEVENELATFDEAFLAHIVLPNNETIADYMLPRVDEAYRTGGMPTLDGAFRLALPAPAP